ncbi:FecCD family ABC transporter permease [Terrihalobacillus insolitus]|uniref:FecCD family ABC transporter permease n=1 Tax=Terrihalobacillus insolitus TaxID=2950438 RepID=UPI0023413CF2|nr:iron ABC transporter permease [Terrihalobacillus insolitus]MDC3414396.1 iron ABC transporter permease [Terrihalobacillus insolitus]
MKKRLLLYGGGAALLLLFSFTLSLSIGSSMIPITEVWSVLLGKGDEVSTAIVINVRLPRIILAILVGSALAVAGAGFQGVLRNPLADPYILGVSSGASFGAAFVILFGLQSVLFGIYSIPIVAFLTGVLTLLLVIKIAMTSGQMKKETLILSGVVVQAFLGSFISLMVSMSGKAINEIVFWMMGSLTMRGWEYPKIMAPYLFIGIVILLSQGRALNLFTLGERQALHLGVNVERTKMVVLITSTLLTASAVSVSGVIGFVGLVVPHLIRMVVGPDYRLIIPLSVFGGSIYVLWADTIARMALMPKEIPLGVVTSLLGAPFFAYLLKKGKKGVKL